MRKWCHGHKNSDRSASSNDALNLFRDEKSTSLASQNNWGPLYIDTWVPSPRALSLVGLNARPKGPRSVLGFRRKGNDILVEFSIRPIKITSSWPRGRIWSEAVTRENWSTKPVFWSILNVLIDVNDEANYSLVLVTLTLVSATKIHSQIAKHQLTGSGILAVFAHA